MQIFCNNLQSIEPSKPLYYFLISHETFSCKNYPSIYAMYPWLLNNNNSPSWKLSTFVVSSYACRITTQFFRKMCTSHFIWKGCVWEGVGDRTELQHIDLPTLIAISVSFPFSRVAQPEARGPSSLLGAVFSTASFLQLFWSPNS